MEVWTTVPQGLLQKKALPPGGENRALLNV